MLSLERRRRIGNHLFAALATLCFLIALVPLVSIIYQTMVKGYTALSLNFLTKITPPIGGTGGGILNAIEGSFVMVAIASMIGIPVGVGSPLESGGIVPTCVSRCPDIICCAVIPAFPADVFKI